MICKTCKGRGWVIWRHRAKVPTPAYWFQRGPDGEQPVVYDCGVID